MNLLKLKFKTTEIECTHYTFNIFPLLFQHNKRRKNISDNFISKQIQFFFLNIFNKKIRNRCFFLRPDLVTFPSLLLRFQMNRTPDNTRFKHANVCARELELQWIFNPFNLYKLKKWIVGYWLRNMPYILWNIRLFTLITLISFYHVRPGGQLFIVFGNLISYRAFLS